MFFYYKQKKRKNVDNRLIMRRDIARFFQQLLELMPTHNFLILFFLSSFSLLYSPLTAVRSKMVKKVHTTFQFIFTKFLKQRRDTKSRHTRCAWNDKLFLFILYTFLFCEVSVKEIVYRYFSHFFSLSLLRYQA